MKERAVKSGFGGFRLVLTAALAAAVAIVVGVMALRWAPRSEAPPPQEPPGVAAAASPFFSVARAAAPNAGTTTLSDIAAAVTHGIVSVSSTRTAKGHSGALPPFGGLPLPFRFGPRQPREREVQGLGSGVIVKANGVILTNHHVIEGATKVVVVLADDREVPAEVVGSDPKTDLAVVQLQEKVAGLTPLPFGDSSALRPGDVVLAIGNPFGIGQTVTMGIVSATGRSSMGIVDYEDFIQTDAAINPGNSGGGLINMAGELVGINTAILSRTGGYQGIGFAIPMKVATPIMQSLIEHGRVSRGWLGVSIQDIDQSLAQALGVKSRSGVLIAEVLPGSPADRAGLQRGDVVTGIGDRAVENSARLRALVAETNPGTKVSVSILRGDEERELRVTLGEQPETEAARPGKAPTGLGLTLAPLTPEARQQLRVPDDVPGGVVVSDVAASSPASVAGLRPGDVLLEIDRDAVESPAQAARRLAGVKRPVAILILRSGSRLFLALDPG